MSVTSFDGGHSLDVVPDTVVLGGTFRAFSNSSFYYLKKRIQEVRTVTTWVSVYSANRAKSRILT